MNRKNEILYTDQTRYLAGIYAVKELPKDQWKNCRKVHNSSHHMRGYLALTDGPYINQYKKELGLKWEKGEKIKLYSNNVYPRYKKKAPRSHGRR